MEQSEVEKLKAENKKLKAQVETLQDELREAKTQLRRAKDPLPYQKPSFKLVSRLVWDCCMKLKKTVGGWLLSMGHLERKFKSLKQIWELLTQDEWLLSDVFPSPSDSKSARPRLPKRFPILAGYGEAVQRSEQTAEEIPHVPFADEGFEAYSYANSS